MATAGRDIISQIFLFMMLNILIILPVQTDKGEFTSSTIDFAFNIYRKVEPNVNENIFISPVSLFIDLALVLPGAKGNTADQMKSALQQTISNTAIYEQVKDLIAGIKKERTNYTLDTANRLYVEKSLTLLPKYQETVQTYFDGSLEKVDFSKNVQKAMKIINNWVKKQTRNKIPSIVSDLDSTTKLVLVNALYFKANWKTTFKVSETKKKSFTTSSGNIVQTDMMSMKDPRKRFNYAKNENLRFEILEIPYSGELISMYILLPNVGNDMNTFENSLNAQVIKEAIKNKRATEMSEITIPKIQMEKSYDVNKALKDLGMKDLFTNAADLSEMTGLNNLNVDKVVQKTYLEVNEKGSEAAAATAVSVIFKSSISKLKPKVAFVANRPFTFFIRDNLNGQIIFLGRYVSPPVAKG